MACHRVSVEGLVPGAPDATPESTQNRFAALAEEDPLERDGQEEFVRVERRRRMVHCASRRPTRPPAPTFQLKSSPCHMGQIRSLMVSGFDGVSSGWTR